MICIIMILLNGWCRMRMRPARLVSYAFLYTTALFLLSHDVAPLRAKIFRAKILTAKKENPGSNIVTKVNEQELHFRL